MGHRARGWARPVAALVMTAVVASALSPAVALSESDSPDPAVRERLVEEFEAVLSLWEAPDSMCVSVNLDGESIFESKSAASLVPASLIKVVTATAALEVMRPDEVYSTKVFARADVFESAADGVLRGDVYLVGQGDPVLSTPRYVSRYEKPVAHTDVNDLADRVFATLRSRGITRIEGRLVGDESWYPDRQRDYSREIPAEGADPVWKRSLVTSNNVGPLSGLLLNDGYSSYIPVRTTAARLRRVRAADPARHAASVFDDLLEARGMVITQRPAAGMAPAPGERTLLGTVQSPPLSEILARMLNFSDNTIAEMVLKEIGRRIADSDRASATAGVEALIAEKLGPLSEGVVIADGSGLSSYSRLSCAAAAELLDLAGPGSPVVEGLSVPGEQGALMNCRPVRQRPAGLNVLRAKTGTLNDVTALAGTTVAAGGETLTFAMIANRHMIIQLGSCNRLRRAMMNAAANYTYGPALSVEPGHRADREALAALFDATGGKAWFNSWGWKTDTPLGRWHGVTTDSAGRVTRLDLGGPFGNNLVGAAPEEIGDLSRLMRLDLSGNQLSGSLPERISDLGELQDVRLGGTDLCVPAELQAWWASFDNTANAGVWACPDPGRAFVDTVGHAHAEHLETLAERGVLDGAECADNRICPDDPIERWTVAVWIVRALEGPDPPAEDGTAFEDVDAAAWWTPFVERLAVLGITRGCGTDPPRFCPDDSVTRAQMASFLVRAFPLDDAQSAGFTDIGDNTHQTDIDALAAAGITVGCSTDPPRFCPAQPVTRAQMATFLTRALGLAEGP